jgi:hypothetical protein
MWIRSGNLLLNGETATSYRLEESWGGARIVFSDGKREIVVAEGEADEIEKRFLLLASELTDLDLAEADLVEGAEEEKEETEAF